MTCEDDSLQGGRWSNSGIDMSMRLLAMDLRTISPRFQMKVLIPVLTLLPCSVLEEYLMNRDVV